MTTEFLTRGTGLGYMGNAPWGSLHPFCTQCTLLGTGLPLDSLSPTLTPAVQQP